MQGYWRNAEETDKTLVDGWLRTGDVGVLDGDGHLKIIDRRKDVIIVSGFNVYPAEVEAALANHPGVAEAGGHAQQDRQRASVEPGFDAGVRPDDLARQNDELPGQVGSRCPFHAPQVPGETLQK